MALPEFAKAHPLAQPDTPEAMRAKAYHARSAVIAELTMSSLRKQGPMATRPRNVRLDCIFFPAILRPLTLH